MLLICDGRQSLKCALCALSEVGEQGMHDAEVERYLFTNEPPDRGDLPPIAASLERDEVFGAQLDGWILEVEVVLRKVKRRRAVVESSILRHKGALHPIRTVPDDILSSIFEWCTLLATYKRETPSMVPVDAPWTLSCVSRRWRALALSSPSLWSTFNLRALPFELRGLREANLTSSLDLMVRRSAGCDLNIRVLGAAWDDVLEDAVIDDELLESCMAILLSTASRWRTAELKDVDRGLIAMLSGTVFERLRSLILTFKDVPDTAFPPVRWHTPSLTRLTLTERVSGVVELSWETLTYYHCQAASFSHLPSCFGLEELELTQIDATSVASVNLQTPITLPRLHTLGMQDALFPLSNLLDLPSLKTLWMDFDQPRPYVYPTLGGAVRRIENLRLGSREACLGSDEALLTFLRECVSVKALYLNGLIAGKEVLVALQASGDPQVPVLLPQLTTLGFERELAVWYRESVMDLVLSRSGGGSRSVRRLEDVRLMKYPLMWEGLERALEWVTESEGTDRMEKWTTIKRNVRVSAVYVEKLFLDI